MPKIITPCNLNEKSPAKECDWLIQVKYYDTVDKTYGYINVCEFNDKCSFKSCPLQLTDSDKKTNF